MLMPSPKKAFRSPRVHKGVRGPPAAALALFAAHGDGALRSEVADAGRKTAAAELARRGVAEIRAVALARVDDHDVRGAGRPQHLLQRRDDGLQQRDVVAEQLAEAA